MPVGRYIFVAGSLLVALLLIANLCLPRSSENSARPDVDKGIRIASPQKWPEKIVFDTRAPAVSPAPNAGAAQADAAVPSVPEAEAVAAISQFDAFAELKLLAAAPKARQRLAGDSKRRRSLHARRTTRMAASPMWPPLPAGW